MNKKNFLKASRIIYGLHLKQKSFITTKLDICF